MTVVNILLIIFRCARLDENFNKNTEPDKKTWLFVWHEKPNNSQSKKVLNKIPVSVVTKAVFKEDNKHYILFLRKDD